jgi:cell division protein FtsI (penicillin-binding protein 3)
MSRTQRKIPKPQPERAPAPLPDSRARRRLVLGMLGLALVALLWRAVDQQVLDGDFLRREGQLRHLRVVEMPAYRGMITDRHGEPLAISTPVHSVWANPRELSPDTRDLAPLARLLDLDLGQLQRTLAKRSERSFVYLKRRVTPDVAAHVSALDLPGLGLHREYRRYYPSAEVTTHLVGFTDIDDRGQEGLELAYEDWLSGHPGKKRVLKDGRDRVVRDVENVQAPRNGNDLVLSLDRRLQFLAYRELKAAVQRHKARSGSAVMLDVRTGEVLALVNQPAYNPNGRRDSGAGQLRNRALTDVLEPGSTMKPFTVAAAMEAGRLRSDQLIDTSPGYFPVGRQLVRDHHNLGSIDVATVLRKSSNVGASKIALELTPEELYSFYAGLGFGALTDSTYPGEVAGSLPHFDGWSRFEQATLSFGYGLSVTSLQLARAYAALAADGVLRPVSLFKLSPEQVPTGKRVMSASTAQTVRRMLESVVSREGTAPKAAVPGYRVSGKTGTAKKSIAGGYAKDRYQALFAGIIPASAPRLAMVVMIDEPSAGDYYGGLVAGPVFAEVMAGAMRLLNVAPDRIRTQQLRLAALEPSQ